MKLFHKDAKSCSFDGKTYKADKDGGFDVPEGAAEHLAPHGFSTAKIEIEQETKTVVSIDAHELIGRELTAAKQRVAELQGKIEALETDLAKAREAAKK